jgi:branched-chain amino acid aminotransferase
MSEAARHRCDQVVFLDATERRYVEELGAMNLFFVYGDGEVVTPASESILERPSLIDEWKEGVASGTITGVFACGTAAVVSPIGRLAWSGGEAISSRDGRSGPTTERLRRTLVDIQYGRADDTRGWMHPIKC